MKTLQIDVIKRNRYYKTLRYHYNPIFRLDPDEICKWVMQQLPSCNPSNCRIEFNLD